jgi:hypothetical protein
MDYPKKMVKDGTTVEVFGPKDQASLESQGYHEFYDIAVQMGNAPLPDHDPPAMPAAGPVKPEYPKTLFHTNLPRLDVHNKLEENNARAGGYTEVQVPKVRNTHPIVGYPKHFYKSGFVARIVYGLQAEAEAIRDGYGPEYIPQEYPKHVGRFTVANAEEEERAEDAMEQEEAAKAAGKPLPPANDLTAIDPHARPYSPKLLRVPNAAGVPDKLVVTAADEAAARVDGYTEVVPAPVPVQG